MKDSAQRARILSGPRGFQRSDAFFLLSFSPSPRPRYEIIRGEMNVFATRADPYPAVIAAVKANLKSTETRMFSLQAPSTGRRQVSS